MAFNSLPYFVFLPAVLLACTLAGDRLRWPVLLAASLGFYAALGAPHLLVALALVAAVTWACGRAVAAAPAGPRRSRTFWAGVAFDVAVLAVLKYVPPLSGRPTLWLSVGVSFYVFQAISYLADVHLGLLEPEAHFGWLFLSLAFFPKLLQGPIERSGALLPQLKAPWRFDYGTGREALMLCVRGLVKKVVIADRMAAFVDAAYADPSGQAGTTLLLATYAYAFQLLFDFSGYTDMALGSARLLGIGLTQNFQAPYSATSIANFWRRWHISFSRWILDYLFTPLLLRWRSVGTAGTAAALLVTFGASGVWHGATWGFVVWGLLHGTYLAASLYWKPYQQRIHGALGLKGTRVLAAWQTIATFHLVCLAWVFFRTPTMHDALAVLRGIAAGVGRPEVHRGDVGLAMRTAVLPLLAYWACARLGFDGDRCRALTWRWPLRWASYLAIGFGLLFLSAPGQRFVYLGF